MLSIGMGRRRHLNPDQLELSSDWQARECQSPGHQGSRLLPAEQFVRNGPYRRTFCRACWAARQRGHEVGKRQADADRGGLERVLTALWRPTGQGAF